MYCVCMRPWVQSPAPQKSDKEEKSRIRNPSLVPVAHARNPTHSGIRDQEDRGSKPAPGK
jgi:hypothetical protein